MEEELVCEMIHRARGIVQQDMAFSMRRRLNTNVPKDHEEFEQKMHDSMQKKQWDIVKKFTVDNIEDVMKYREGAHLSDKQLVDGILHAINNEIDGILLED